MKLLPMMTNYVVELLSFLKVRDVTARAWVCSSAVVSQGHAHRLEPGHVRTTQVKAGIPQFGPPDLSLHLNDSWILLLTL